MRDAVEDDRDALVDVFLGCWTQTYLATMPVALVTAMTHERAERFWAGAIASAAPSELIVAEASSALVAETPSAVLGVTRWWIEPSNPPTGYVASLYVAPSAQGGGVGALLLDAATRSMAAAGATSARLWVFRDNAPAISFYRRHGWLPDGQVRVEDEFGEPEIGLARQLVER